MSQLQDYVATTRDDTLYVGLYADARITTDDLELSVTTDYPWDGEVTITVQKAPEEERAIALRIPSWAVGAQVDGATVEAGWAVVRRGFVAGDTVRLRLPMAARAHGSHPYSDATRGGIAVARGPLVYCVEQQDVETPVDDLLVTPTAVAGATARRQEEHVVLELTAGVAPTPSSELYPVITEQPHSTPTQEVPVTLVPYFLWGNRQALAMRVWLRAAN
jgi:DUF1680 family protein